MLRTLPNGRVRGIAIGVFSTVIGCAELAGVDDYQMGGSPAFAKVPPPGCGHLAIPVGNGGCRDVGVPASINPGITEPWDASSDLGCLDPKQADLYVDLESSGEIHDGSTEHPFRSIQAAVDAVGETIVVAPGTYLEAVTIHRRVRLFAQCPREAFSWEEAIVDATLLNQTSVTLKGRGADGSEIHGVVVRGLRGVLVAGAHDALLHRISARDTKGEGLRLDDAKDARLDRISVENAAGAGLVISNSAGVRVENSQVSNTYATGYRGRGVELSFIHAGGDQVRMKNTLVRGSAGSGVYLDQASASLEDVTIEDSGTAMPAASGIRVENGVLTLTRSLVANSANVGVYVSSGNATLIHSVVRGAGRAQPADEFSHASSGAGLRAIESKLTIQQSLFENNTSSSILVQGTTLTIDDSIVRGTSGRDGIAMYPAGGAEPASAIIRRSRVEQTARAAIANFGTLVDLGFLVLECNEIDVAGSDYGEDLTPRTNYYREPEGFYFADSGGNICGCGQDWIRCGRLNGSLAPSSFPAKPLPPL